MKELFGQRLREQRQNQGLTMEQLAEKANLSTNFIGAIERGLKEPSLSYAHQHFERAGYSG